MAVSRKKSPARPTPRKRVKKVALNPDLSTVRLVINSADNVIDSLGFWFKRLRELHCPTCRVKGSLSVEHAHSGIIVACDRRDNKIATCDFEQEVLFSARAPR